MTTAVYLFGPPGSGKSTTLRALVEHYGATTPKQDLLPLPHIRHEPSDWVELGRLRESFGGTDALGYSVMPIALDFVKSASRPTRLIAEGDRLATSAFFDALRNSYDAAVFVHLDNDSLAATRCADRADRLGIRPPNPSWWQGRASKSHRLAAEVNALPLDPKLSTAHLVAAIVAAIRKAEGA